MTMSRPVMLRIFATAISICVIISVVMPSQDQESILVQMPGPVLYPAHFVQLQQRTLQSLAEKCKGDNPLSEIAEPNVFSGPVGWGPDWPETSGPEPDCDSMKMVNFRKTYEIAEPNFKKWQEYKSDYNVFPYTKGKSGPDAPLPIKDSDNIEDIFDGHGGIVGLEDSMDWKGTPESAAPKVFGKYADGSTKGMDYNVFGNGYKFPDY